jgi:fused signal recognition particle receptor
VRKEEAPEKERQKPAVRKPETPKPKTAKPETAPESRAVPKPKTAEPVPEPEIVQPAPEREIAPKPETVHGKPEIEYREPAAGSHGAAVPSPPALRAEGRMPEAEKPRKRLKLGIVGAVKSFITREVEITEKDVRGMAEDLELELLEADVDIGVAEGIRQELMGRLVGSKVSKDKLHSFVSDSIKETLVDVLTNEKAFDIVERVGAKGGEPVKIVFLGINGAGKTTTIGKVARLLMDNNKKIVFAAADTFRAAAIEQMGVHADRLGVKMIKREYGSDPTSVAFDAVNYAKAHGMDAVLIDTAGRQDTNISLINEMKKMDRVIKPDIKIYIGESIAGNAIIDQISAFDREIGVDAVILTKLDCDPKGGTMLSINKATGVPIIYVGVGQRYEDLERFDPKKIVGRIVE